MAHTVHVDALLASMEPWEFDEWMMAFNAEPWDIGLVPDTEDEEKVSPLEAMRRLAGV